MIKATDDDFQDIRISWAAGIHLLGANICYAACRELSKLGAWGCFLRRMLFGCLFSSGEMDKQCGIIDIQEME